MKPSRGVCGALRWEYDDSRCHFACSRFPMHRRLTFASPVRTVSRDFRFRRGVLVFSVACVTRGRHRAPALPSQLPFLIERGSCVLHAPRFIDGGRALRARSAVDRRKAIRKRIARTVVDDGHERARTGGAARLPHSCHLLLSVVSAFSRCPRYYCFDTRA